MFSVIKSCFVLMRSGSSSARCSFRVQLRRSDPRAPRRIGRVVQRRARGAQRPQKHLRRHALDAQLPLLGGGAFSSLLPRNVGDEGVLDLLRRDDAAQKAADDRAGAVGVGQDDQAAPLRQPPQQRLALVVAENGEAVRAEDVRVHDLAQRVLVVAALHHDDLPDAHHVRPPPRCGRTAPAAVRGGPAPCSSCGNHIRRRA